LSVYWDFPPLPYIYCCRIKVWDHDHEHAAQGGGADVKHTHVTGTHTLRECGLSDTISEPSLLLAIPPEFSTVAGSVELLDWAEVASGDLGSDPRHLFLRNTDIAT